MLVHIHSSVYYYTYYYYYYYDDDYLSRRLLNSRPLHVARVELRLVYVT